MADSAFFCTLTHEGVLAVIGTDASTFLQGQLTCNLNYLSETRSSLGARCTQKGRMQSSFRILLQPDGCLLAMARELVEPQLADLKKYAVFSKSKLTDDSANWVRFGLSGADAVLAGLGLDGGWLVIFDRRPGLAPVEERLAHSVATSPGGRRITVIRA